MAISKKNLLAIILPLVAVGVVLYSFIAPGGAAEESEFEEDEAYSDEMLFDDGFESDDGDGFDLAKTPDLDWNGENSAPASRGMPSSPDGGQRTSSNDPSLDDESPVSSRLEDVLVNLLEKRKRLGLLPTASDSEASSSESVSVVEHPQDSSTAELESRVLAPTLDDLLLELENLELRGILTGPTRACALLGGYIVREGELLPNGIRVVQIDRKSVTLRRDDEELEAIKYLEPLASSRIGTGHQSDEDSPEESSSNEGQAPAADDPAPAEPEENLSIPSAG